MSVKKFIPATIEEGAEKQGEKPKSRRIFINQDQIIWFDTTKRLFKTSDGEVLRVKKGQISAVLKSLDIANDAEPFSFNSYRATDCPF